MASQIGKNDFENTDKKLVLETSSIYLQSEVTTTEEEDEQEEEETTTRVATTAETTTTVATTTEVPTRVLSQLEDNAQLR